MRTLRIAGAWVLLSVPLMAAMDTCGGSMKPSSLGFATMGSSALAKSKAGGLARRAPAFMGLSMQNRDYRKSGTEFDLLDGKDFDILALRSFRREAKLKYSNLNQSEPLRILIFGLLFFLSVSYQKIATALGEPITDLQRVQQVAVAIPSLALFLRERGRRTKQLVRMDKECAIGDLELILKDAMSGTAKTFKVRELRGKRRLMAFYGTKEYLREQLAAAAVYRRRYQSSQMAIVAVSSDGSSRRDWGLPEGADGTRGFWLWEVDGMGEWVDYFEELLEGKLDQSEEEGSWIALNMKGRSCASGLGAPIVDELLGSKMPPLDLLEESDAPMIGDEAEDVKELYQEQAKFYSCLTEGKTEEMLGLWGEGEDKGVTEFISLGGRLDPWDNQLKDGARPEGMRVMNKDALLLDDQTAVTTCIEVPATGTGQTLLATQRWRRKEGGGWEMVGHKTIPYCMNTGALAVLRCDKRGCACGIRDSDRANKNPFVLPRP